MTSGSGSWSRSWSSGFLDKAFRHSTHATLPLANVAVSSIVLQHVAVLAYCKELQMPLQLQLSTLNTTSCFCNTTSCFWRCVRMCVCVCVCYDVSSGLHNSLGVHLFRLLDYNYSIWTSERGSNRVQHTRSSLSWYRRNIRFIGTHAHLQSLMPPSSALLYAQRHCCRTATYCCRRRSSLLRNCKLL